MSEGNRIKFHPLPSYQLIICTRRSEDGEEISPVVYSRHGVHPDCRALTDEQRNDWNTALKEMGWREITS